MKKFINDADNYISEVLEGIYLAHQDKIQYINNDRHCLVTKYKNPGKVAIVTGGGSGHLPLFLGYVGEGMLDGCASGDVFQSPSPDQILSITRHVDNGAGVLYLYGNYNGDIFNFNMAAEMAEMENGIHTETVVVADDVASAISEKNVAQSTRRGVAGMVLVYKCAGAAASQMQNLTQVKNVALKACDNVRTMGIALSPCIVPRIGKPGFQISEDEMEIGMGIHGETGIRRGKKLPADEIINEVMEYILADLPYQAGDEVAVLINGLGATPLEEQYLIYRRVWHILKNNKIIVFKNYIGEYATSLEMAGASISLLRVDNELKTLLQMPANTPMFKQF